MLLGGNTNNRRPSWVTAVVIFIVLIAVVQMIGRQQPSLLEEQFAAVTPNAGFDLLPIPALPPELAELARTTTARILGGQAGAPVQTDARNEVMRVQITRIESKDTGLQLRGSVTNISSTPISISLDAFRFVDATNTVYAASGTEATQLQPDQQAPLDLTLPVQNPTLLRLTVTQAGQSNIEMTLLDNRPASSPAP